MNRCNLCGESYFGNEGAMEHAGVCVVMNYEPNTCVVCGDEVGLSGKTLENVQIGLRRYTAASWCLWHWEMLKIPLTVSTYFTREVSA